MTYRPLTVQMHEYVHTMGYLLTSSDSKLQII